MKTSVKVWQSNSGRYIAEYKIGTVRFQRWVSGETEAQALANAKLWLTTPIYGGGK